MKTSIEDVMETNPQTNEVGVGGGYSDELWWIGRKIWSRGEGLGLQRWSGMGSIDLERRRMRMVCKNRETADSL
jgi:hypothetical protein